LGGLESVERQAGVQGEKSLVKRLEIVPISTEIAKISGVWQGAARQCSKASRPTPAPTPAPAPAPACPFIYVINLSGSSRDCDGQQPEGSSPLALGSAGRDARRNVPCVTQHSEDEAIPARAPGIRRPARRASMLGSWAEGSAPRPPGLRPPLSRGTPPTSIKRSSSFVSYGTI